MNALDKRDNKIDILKGIGIILIVLGHVNNGEGYLYDIRNFVYQFHVPLFFFASGLLYVRGEKLFRFIFKKIRRLYIPFVSYNIICLFIAAIANYCLGTPLDRIYLVDLVSKIFLFIDSSPIMGGPTWFLCILFFALLLYKVVDDAVGYIYSFNIILRECIFSGICMICCYIGLNYWLPAALNRSLVALFFLHVGSLAYKYGLYKYYIQMELFVHYIIVFSMWLIILRCSQINFIEFAGCQFGIKYLFFISSFAGILMSLSLTSIIDTLSCSRNERLIYCGRNSMWIMLGHYPAFKIICFLQCMFLSLPINLIIEDRFPSLDGIWPLLYLISGLGIPISFARIVDKLILEHV